MENIFEDKPKWSSHEMNMINHVEVFLHKPAIMKKGVQLLTALGDRMIKELIQSEICFPQGTKLNKTQMAKGENNNGFPFLSLDIPQMFSKTEMFTFRTLFWWGHYLGFSLILKGDQLSRYTSKLIENIKNPSWSEVYLAITPTPWEWGLNDQNFKKVSESSGKEIEKIIETIDYIKVMRVFPMKDPTFASLDWAATGSVAWRDLSSLAKV